MLGVAKIFVSLYVYIMNEVSHYYRMGQDYVYREVIPWFQIASITNLKPD